MIPYEHWATAPNPPTVAERRSGRFWFWLISALFLAIALSAAGCAGNKPQGKPAEAYAPKDSSLFPVKQQVADTHLRVNSAPVPSQAKPGLLSGIGSLFSTPEGVARRQAVRMASAAAPKFGKKAQGIIQSGTGNAATLSNTEKKGTSATGKGAKTAVAGKNSTLATDSAAATNSKGGAVAVGPNAHAEGGATVQEAPGFWGTLAKPLGYLACVVGAGIVVYLLYLIWAFLPRRKTNNQA